MVPVCQTYNFFSVLKMTCAFIRQFIDSHNNRRRLLVRGLEPDQPAASAMYQMVGGGLFIIHFTSLKTK